MASLRGRLALALGSVFLLLAAAFVTLTAVSGRLFLAEAQQRLHQDLAANIVGEKLLMTGGALQPEAVKDVFMMMMVVNPSIEAYLLDPQGRILSFSAPPGRVVRQAVDTAPIASFLAHDRLPIYGDDPRSATGRKIFSAAPIEEGGRREGYLYVVLSGQRHDSVFGTVAESWILRLALASTLGFLVAAALTTLLVVRRLTRPLLALTRDIEAFAQQEERAAALPPAAGDELARLRIRFDQMAQRIRDQLAELAATDRARRELVAGVSHDLRTPLTHLQGYLETLLLKEEIGETERRDYLQIAFEECLRLSRLVADLFELAKLETLAAPVEREVFSLAELAHDVAQKFRLAALKQGVDLVVEAPAEARLRRCRPAAARARAREPARQRRAPHPGRRPGRGRALPPRPDHRGRGARLRARNPCRRAAPRLRSLLPRPARRPRAG